MPHTDLLRAYTTYQTELAAGGDGRPDYVERKTCNWITETFQVVQSIGGRNGQRSFVEMR